MKSMSEMGLTQSAEFFRALDKAGFNAEIAQKIITSKDNFHAKKMLEAFLEYEKFGSAVVDFEFKVPIDYELDSNIYISAMNSLYQRRGRYFNYKASEIFKMATHKLEPGEVYRVRIFPILEKVTSEECLNFLKKKGALLVGAHGLVILLNEERRYAWRQVEPVLSFDEKCCLGKDTDGNHLVPYHNDSIGGKFYFDWFDENHSGNIICFSRKKI